MMDFDGRKKNGWNDYLCLVVVSMDIDFVESPMGSRHGMIGRKIGVDYSERLINRGVTEYGLRNLHRTFDILDSSV